MNADSAIPEVAGPQAESAVTAQPPADTAPAILDGARRALLRSVLNCLVPPHDGLPGAGDLDVGTSIERSMAGSARLRRLLLEGLAELAITSDRDHSVQFVDLDSDRQITVLEHVERTRPAFFVALVEHAYRGYYLLPAVHQAIGHESRPPQPLGHRLPPFEPKLLDTQRQRLPFWRQTDS